MKKDREKKVPIAAVIDRRQFLLGLATLVGMALLLIIGLTPETASAPVEDPGSAEANVSAQALEKDCQVVQHLTYSRCGHELTRRQTLPEELAGKGRVEAEQAYDLWQITGFAPGEVTMEQATALYCPAHQVLLPDESGSLCIFENRYGDAYALVEALNVPLTSLPEKAQEQVRAGLGFDSREALLSWLESAES